MLCNMRRGLGACVSSVWTNVSELSGFLCAQRSFFWSPNNLINLLDVCRRFLAGTCWHISRMLNHKVCLLCVFGFSRLPMSHDMSWYAMMLRQQRGQPLAKCCCRCKRWMMRLAKAASNGCPEDGQLYIYYIYIYVLICGDMCDTRMAFVL